MPMKNPNHPGDIIRGCLDELGVNATDGAKALGVTRSALSRLINRKAGVSVEMACGSKRPLAARRVFGLRLQLSCLGTSNMTKGTHRSTGSLPQVGKQSANT